MKESATDTNKVKTNPKKYFLNTKTNKLHIFGKCHHSNSLPSNIKYFDTENDAVTYAGRAMSMCKICLKNRDES